MPIYLKYQKYVHNLQLGFHKENEHRENTDHRGHCKYKYNR